MKNDPDRDTGRKDLEKTRTSLSIYKSRREASEKTDSADTLISVSKAAENLISAT